MGDQLLVMRIVDMHRVHPAQDNTRVCGKCKEPVGIYPSGQKALEKDPTLEIVCNVCCPLPDPDMITMPAGSPRQMVKESRESVDVKKV